MEPETWSLPSDTSRNGTTHNSTLELPHQQFIPDSQRIRRTPAFSTYSTHSRFSTTNDTYSSCTRRAREKRYTNHQDFFPTHKPKSTGAGHCNSLPPSSCTNYVRGVSHYNHTTTITNNRSRPSYWDKDSALYRACNYHYDSHNYLSLIHI